jgi:formylglycine-generating enzyme required for sulfatase activity
LEELDRIIKDTFQIGDKIVDGPKLVRIPAGRYLIGSEEDETQFQVINEFAIGQFPVTFCQYDLFCEASGCEQPNDMGWGRENRPVINVSFFDATNYIKWLCKRTGKKYRLPTAVEWEYAARAGTDSAYWWGNEIKRDDKFMANCNGYEDPRDKKRKTSPVGYFPPNDWSLYDTVGNVWEWTRTIYANNYKRDDRTEGEVPLDKSSQVIIKGGSWYDKPDRLHWSIRQPFYVDDKTDSIGFRVAYSLPSLR